MKHCKVKGCETKSRTWGLCPKHYTRKKRYGTTKRLTGKPNKVITKTNYAEIVLFGGVKGLIDVSDIGKVKSKVWSYSKGNGVIHQWQKDNKNYHIKLHRMLTNCPKGKVVDHINGNNLDNRRKNLRVVNQWENVINQKSKPNRNIEKSGSGFSVRMKRKKKRYYLGYYQSFEDAKKARDYYADKLHKGIRLR